MCPHHRGSGGMSSKIPPKLHGFLIFKRQMIFKHPRGVLPGLLTTLISPASSKTCTICSSLNPAIWFSLAAPAGSPQSVKPPTLRCKVSKTNQLSGRKQLLHVFSPPTPACARKASSNFFFFWNCFSEILFYLFMYFFPVFYLKSDCLASHWIGSPSLAFFSFLFNKKHNILHTTMCLAPSSPRPLQLDPSSSSSHFTLATLRRGQGESYVTCGNTERALEWPAHA